LEVLVGNYGQNYKYHVSAEHAFYLLDNSGTNEILPTYYIHNGKGEVELFPDFDRNQIAE
jgi:hypothetical protein